MRARGGRGLPKGRPDTIIGAMLDLYREFGQTSIRRLTKLERGGSDLLVIDLLLAKGPVGSSAWRTRIRRAWEGGRIPVVSKRSLIAMKRLRGAKLDLADIAVLKGMS